MSTRPPNSVRPPPPAAPSTRVHVAAMPFPTAQGTQAAVHAMAEADASRGATTLLTYGRGHEPRPAGYAWVRAADLPGHEQFRSGPSARKVALDASLALSLRRVARGTPRATVVAHHVEAAACARLATGRPTVMVAHTDLAAELPTYLAPQSRWAKAAAKCGAHLDRLLLGGGDAVAAVSPVLADHLTRTLARPVSYLPIPWHAAPAITPRERADARQRLDLPTAAPVLLYAGNLDAYQGWQDVIAALVQLVHAREGVDAHLLVATASDPAPLHTEARSAGVAHRIHVLPLHTENDRQSAHAAADVVVVPRRTPGGLPVKLLDALGRGVPTVAARRATAGLRLDSSAWVVDDDAPAALAQGVLAALGCPDAARARTQGGLAHLATAHSQAAYLAAMAPLEGAAQSFHRAGGRRRGFWYTLTMGTPSYVSTSTGESVPNAVQI